MNCAACERNLSAYIDDELIAEMRREIEVHLDECEPCRAEFEAHQAVWEAAGLVPAGPVPEGVWEGVQAGLQPEGGGTSLEEVALMLRGLAGEVRDLRQAVDSLQRDLEEAGFTEEREAPAREREVRPSRYVAGRPHLGMIEEVRRSS